MDDRSLRELELLGVARLYGLDARSRTNTMAPGVELPAPTPLSMPPEPAPADAPPVLAVEGIGRMDWEALRRAVRECRRCGLCEKRKQAVFGVGHESAPWLFVGEGPGADEDEQGEPFVGHAGKLLDSMLAALGLQRGREVYIANVVKCRPPGNRVPAPGEAAACAPFLDRQVELIQPKLIVALGRTAAIRLTGAETSLASLRSRVHAYRGIPLVITYHPAYLLRNLPDKSKAWEDLLFARRTFVAAGA